MDNYPWKDNIKLEEAMKREMKSRVRMWMAHNFCQDKTNYSAFVLKSDNHSQVTFGYVQPDREHKGVRFNTLGKFASLEELRGKYPKLFEIDGLLYVFS